MAMVSTQDSLSPQEIMQEFILKKYDVFPLKDYYVFQIDHVLAVMAYYRSYMVSFAARSLNNALGHMLINLTCITKR